MHQDETPQFVVNLHERIEEVLESIRAVKGDRFADMVYVSFMGAHAVKMVGTAMADVDETIRDVVGRQLGHSIAAFMSLLAEMAQLSEQDCKELMNWSDTLCGHVSTAIKEAP